MSAPSSSAVPPNYDPFAQNFTLLGRDGEDILVSMSDIDYLRIFGIRLAINYGSQIGASALILLVTILLTRQEKRRSWIFAMNCLCLVLNTTRSILQSLYLTGNYWNFYSQLANDGSHDTWRDQVITVTSNTTTLLLVMCIMVSLSMQVWVVCITTPTIQRAVIMTVTSIIALIAIGYRFAVTVMSNLVTMQEKTMAPYDGLLDTQKIVQAIAIWAYCAVFTFKLGHAIIQRRKLGMTQFGPMQIIFIMGAQTMVIPAIFTCLQFYEEVPELGSQTLTIVCIFLPLSAIWASVIANDTNIASSGANAHQRLLEGQFGRTSPASTGYRSPNYLKRNITASTDSKEPDSPATFYKPKDSVDGIHVGREWSVAKGEASNAYDRV